MATGSRMVPNSGSRLPPREVKSTKLILPDFGSGLGSSNGSTVGLSDESILHLRRSETLSR